MIKKCIVILVAFALLSQLWTGGLFQNNTVQAQGPSPTSKISSLLALQVQAKLRAVTAGGLPAALTASQQAGQYDILSAPGLNLEHLDKQQIFIHFAQQPTQTQIAELEALGITPYPDSWIPPVGDNQNGFITADIPINGLSTLAEKSYVVRLETAERRLQPQNDLATQKINAPAVWTSGYNGTGVRIAVLDSGLDLTQPDIPTPVAKKDFSAYPVLDDTIANTVSGHGTHVTGSVLGRGTQSGGLYKGSAPGADLIFLKIGSDAGGGASSAAIANAIKAATDNYSAKVITMSYGGWDVFHDGSSEEAQAVDYAVSRGAVVTIATGNDAAAKKHYSGSVAGGSTTGNIQINVSGAGTSDTTLWYNLVWYDGLGTHNNLSAQFYNSDGATPINTPSETSSESTRGTESKMAYIGPSLGNLYALPSGAGTYYIKVTNPSGVTQAFHLYLWMSGAGTVTFQNADPNYTVASPADADSAIAVGAYTTRRTWYDYANNGWTATSETLDQITTFSNRGPRVDAGAPGKPSFVAPGAEIISVRDNVVYPWASHDLFYVDNNGPNENNATKNNGAGPADYYVMQGTSMATPIAAGVAALIIQKNPAWTPAQVRNALESTATDKGAAGRDNDYGWGLINAQAAVSVQALAVATNPADTITSTSARLKGSLNSLGILSSANASFQWGTISGNLTQQTSLQLMGSTANFSANLTGLAPSTTYYFRAKAVGDGIAYGNELSFTTSAGGLSPPVVTTKAATNITLNSVTLNGSLDSLGGYSSANVSFAWGNVSGNLLQQTSPQIMGSTGNFSANVSSMSSNTTYYFRAVVTVSGN